MERRQRVRRTAFICLHTIANVACLRAGRDTKAIRQCHHFYSRAHSNFADIAILSWCKVFADKKGMHYCLNVVSDPSRFMRELLNQLQITQADFDAHIRIVKNLRDKFIAHLDSDITAPLPKLDLALNSVGFLLEYLFRHENHEKHLEGIARFPDPIYRLAYDDARLAYKGEPDVRRSGGRAD